MADKSQKEIRKMRKAAELYHRGLEFMHNDNHKAAFECYTNSLQHHPTVEAFVSRAAVNLQEKRFFFNKEKMEKNPKNKFKVIYYLLLKKIKVNCFLIKFKNKKKNQKIQKNI